MLCSFINRLPDNTTVNGENEDTRISAVDQLLSDDAFRDLLF